MFWSFRADGMLINDTGYDSMGGWTVNEGVMGELLVVSACVLV